MKVTLVKNQKIHDIITIDIHFSNFGTYISCNICANPLISNRSERNFQENRPSRFLIKTRNMLLFRLLYTANSKWPQLIETHLRILKLHSFCSWGWKNIRTGVLCERLQSLIHSRCRRGHLKEKHESQNWITPVSKAIDFETYWLRKTHPHQDIASVTSKVTI